LLQSLQNLDYPANRYEVWAIDDGSTDNTPLQLERWQTQMPQLQVYRRPLGSSGGKSAALNEVLPQTRGEIVGVFDADAVVPADLLRRSLPLFQQHERIAAVQVRKAIGNRDTNIWTRGQSAEMAFDSYLQQQRQAVGGLGELRGNGQLVRRAALERAGGWNEATITDDLDLTFRLHLSGDDVAYLANPAVQEEGVTSWGSLWHQRSRWAEGGYQRYLDYWPGIVTNHLGTTKTLDLVLFFLMQYLLPLAFIPDTILTLFYSHQPALWPLGGLCSIVAATGIAKGLQRTHQLQGLALLRTTALGVAYMLHWVPVMATTTLRMCIRPKQLKWVKTLHIGTPYDASPIEQPNQ
jgi:1,2-diacylglycerol 3-beta-glucosyltransferase